MKTIYNEVETFEQSLAKALGIVTLVNDASEPGNSKYYGTNSLGIKGYHDVNAMIYPGAGIPLSTGTAWSTSIIDNSANWNTAYGWGNHAGLYDAVGTASGLVGTHESTYNHLLIATALQAESDPVYTSWYASGYPTLKRLTIENDDPNNPILTLKGASGQSASMLVFKDNDSNDVLVVKSNGQLGVLTGDAADTFTVGSNKFRVNSAGNLVRINNVYYTWPGLQGDAGTYLKNDGAGSLTWEIIDFSAYVPYTGATADLNLGAHALTFANGETIGNPVNGTITLTGVGGSENQTLKFNLSNGDTSSPQIDSDSATIEVLKNLRLMNSSVMAFGDNGNDRFGQFAMQDDSDLQISTTAGGINLAPNSGATSITGSLTVSGLTSGRIPYATTAGLLTDSANLTFNGTNFGVTGLATFSHTSYAGLFIRTGLNADSNWTVTTVRAIRDGQMADGFGPTQSYEAVDADNVANSAGAIGFVRSGADNSYRFICRPTVAGTGYESFSAGSDYLKVGSNSNIDQTFWISSGTGGTKTSTIKMGTVTAEWKMTVDASPYTWHLDYAATSSPLANIIAVTRGGKVNIGGLLHVGADVTNYETYDFTVSGSTGGFVLHRTSASESFFLLSNTAGAVTLRKNGTKGAVLESSTAVALGTGARLSFAGYYTGATHLGANSPYIEAYKETATDGEYGFALAFGTRANGVALSEKMRITGAGELLIGATTASGYPLEISTTNPAIFLKNGSTRDLTIDADVSGVAQIKYRKTTGTATIDFDPVPQDGTGAGTFRFFRTTNTAGAVYFDGFKGDGTATYQFRFGGNVDSYVCANNSNFGIGTTGPDAKVDILSTTEQLRLTYTDGSVYTSFTTDSGGGLTISPTGDVIKLDGFVGVNMAASSSIILGTSGTFTLAGATGEKFGIQNRPTFTAGIDQTTSVQYGMSNGVYIDGDYDFNVAYGIQAFLRHNGTANSNIVRGDAFNVQVGIGANGGTATQLNAINIAPFKISGTIGTLAAIRIAAITQGSTNYAIYSEGGNSYHAGSLGVGISLPDAKVEILSTTEQLRLTYTDASVYAGFTLTPTGELEIAPSGSLVNIRGGASSQLYFHTTASGNLSTDGANFSLVGTDFYFNNREAGNFYLYNNGALRLTIASTGVATFAGDVYVGASIAAIASSGYLYSNGFVNIASQSNAALFLNATGTVITRNIADANIALKVQQVHASSTGPILSLWNNTGPVAVFSQAGALTASGIAAGKTYDGDAKAEFLSTTEQLRLTYTDGSVYTSFTVDSSGDLTISNTGTKTTFSDSVFVGSAIALSVTSGLMYSNGFVNSATGVNSTVSLATTGTVISRNVADANVATIIKQLHASSTGDILQLWNSGGSVWSVSQTGILQAAGYKSSDGTAGATGSFTTADLKTVTVKDGIITSIV